VAFALIWLAKPRNAEDRAAPADLKLFTISSFRSNGEPCWWRLAA